MSYARWSSDDWQSAVYVYADVSGGWTTHVATRHRVPCEPLPPRVSLRDDVKGYMKREEKVREILDRSPWANYNLPHDGETFNDPTPGACADRLEGLRDMGYPVPQYAINSLREEAKP